MPRLVRFLAVAVLSLSAAYAQGVSGSAAIAGTVTDATGAVIPGATVTLINVERGSEQEISSNEAGNFAYPDVIPGVYTVRVTSDGFETQEITDLTVAIGQRAAVNVELAVGQVTNVVTVEAAAVLLETESNAIGTVVEKERVNELPLNGRNFLQLALLAGGVAPAEGRATFEGQIGHPGRFVVIGGVKAANNSYTINGIQVRGARGGELAVNLSVANVDQFKVQSSFFMPDQGPNPSMVNVTTNGGSNQFHGRRLSSFATPNLTPATSSPPARRSLNAINSDSPSAARLFATKCGSVPDTKACASAPDSPAASSLRRKRCSMAILLKTPSSFTTR